MKKYNACVGFLLGFLILWNPALWAQTDYNKPLEVRYVIDGDTFVLKNGDHVRVVSINAPEISHKKGKASMPFAQKSKQFTQNFVRQKPVNLVFNAPENRPQTDRHHRLLAHVYTGDVSPETWLNGALVREGLAYVYSFPDNVEHVDTLLKLEAEARTRGKGIWSSPRYQVRSAKAPYPEHLFGLFGWVKGTVYATAKVGDKIFLNFGPNWREDFSVEIRERNWEHFYAANIDPVHFYKGKTVLVRGVVKPVNGALVTVTHPQQLEILN